MKIDGEIYPIRNPVDPTDVIYVQEKRLEDKFKNPNDDNVSTSISLKKPDGTKPNDEFEDLTSSQTTSYLSVTYGGGYANKLPKHTSDRDIKDCIMTHLSRLRIINEHRQRILDRTNVLDDLTPRDTLETVNNFLKSINTPKLNNENEAWAKIDAWIDTNFPSETQSSIPENQIESTDICENCNGDCEDCEHYDPVKELTKKLESTCDQNSETPVGDIFVQISKSNDKILEQVIPTFIKVIDRQMRKIDITIHRDRNDNIVDKHGNAADVPYIRVDGEGNLTAVDIDVRLMEVYDALPYKLTSNIDGTGDLPTYDSFLSFVDTLNIVITDAIANHYPTMKMKFSFKDINGLEYRIKYRVKDRLQGDVDKIQSILHIEITKPSHTPEDDKQLFLRVLKDRVMYYHNNGNYGYLSRNLKEIHDKIPLSALANDEKASMQNDDVGKLLNPIYSNLLGWNWEGGDNLYRFIKKNYHEVFEFFMQYNVYAYVTRSDYGISYLILEPKPRWYSYITQPALREKVRNEKHQCCDIDN